MKLAKGMYPCQDVPVIIFDQGCSKPCLYCGLSNRVFSEETIIATGLENILAEVINFKGVYLSPTSDCFLPQNAELTHSLLEQVWKRKELFTPLVITKQIIPNKTIKLFIKNKHRLVLQVSVPSANEEVISILEPGSALISERLKMIKKLTEAGIPVIAVAMPWFNLDSDINALPNALANVGVLRAIVATGVLTNRQKQRMINSGNKQIENAAFLIRGSTSNGYVLPIEEKVLMLKKITEVFSKAKIKSVVCTSDNHDLDGNELPLCTKFKHHNF